MEPLYYGQILFNVLVGGRTAGAEIKMRKQSAPAVEVLIQKLTTVLVNCFLLNVLSKALIPLFCYTIATAAGYQEACEIKDSI